MGDIRILSIPTMCLLPDLFHMFLPQRGHTYADVQGPGTILFSHSFSSFLGFGPWALGGVKHVYHLILIFPDTWI